MIAGATYTPFVAAETLAAARRDRAASPEAVKEKVMEQAREFEAVFLSSYLKTMWDGVGDDPTLAGGTGSDNWKELLIDEYGKSYAARGGIGLAEPIAHQLLKLQEIDP